MSWGIGASLLLAILFLSLSFVDFSRFRDFRGEVKRVEKRLHERQNKLEGLALGVLNAPKNDYINQEEIDEDFVIYKYHNDSLCAWGNTLPILHDEISMGEYLNRRLRSQTEPISQYPLLLVNENEQYKNFGNAWYVVRAYYKAPYTVVAALLIQTDYPFTNTFIKNSVNPRLRLANHFSIIPVSFDEGYLVFSRDDRSVLFSVLIDVRLFNQQSSTFFRWISLFCALLALFFIIKRFPKPQTLWVLLPSLGLLRWFCTFLEDQMAGTPIVSPALYADAHFSGSFLNLLLNNLFIFFGVAAIVFFRRPITRFFFHLREEPHCSLRRIFWMCLLAALPIILFIYLHFSFRSVIHNSSIVMEIFKVNELSRYSIYVYASLGLLFTALYLSIFLCFPLWIKRGSRSILLSQKVLAGYIVAVSLYSLLIVSSFGARKEMERNRVWTQKMAIERDPDTEVDLRMLENRIATDPLLNLLVQADHTKDMIYERLVDYFFASLNNKYDIQFTTCRPGVNLYIDDTPPPITINCYLYFHAIISSCGTQLHEDSYFYYLDNGNGRTSYIGVFPFRYPGGYCDLYIELDSRSVKEIIGYPELLRDETNQALSLIPFGYSFAKYVRGDLNAFSGSYNYPTQSDTNYPPGTFELIKRDGYLHYVNSFDQNTLIILSRPAHTFFLYVVSFSYLALFYGFILFAIMHFRISILFRAYRSRSFRRKITLLVVVSLIGALVFMGYGSSWFGVKLYNDNIRRAMEDKVQTTQSILGYSFQYLDGEQLDMQLALLSKNGLIDFNIYDAKGWLVRTSQPELIEKHLIGRRMNSRAFEQMDRYHQLTYFHKEHIGNLYFYSAYAPLFTDRGTLMGYLNLPYFSKESEITSDLASIIAAIANIYILLLLAAILTATAISNQLGRPLIEVAKKMQRLDITKQREHINYKGKDELGGLIHSYNKMVDDVAEASQRIAESEREQAWREMARQIAHEIKNPLTPMRLSLQHLMRLKKENVPDWPERFDGLAHTLIEQIDILSDAASELSSFSRFYNEEAAPVELNHLIREQCTLFNTGDAIKLYFISEVHSATVMGRKQQLTRVLVNLISNAKQAVEGYAGGRIRIRLEQQEDAYILRIEDNGPGVPEKLRGRLFTPNFTTKSGGTGLGLAICRSIIEQSQGAIAYTISEWGGACFIIKLPVFK